MMDMVMAMRTFLVIAGWHVWAPAHGQVMLEIAQHGMPGFADFVLFSGPAWVLLRMPTVVFVRGVWLYEARSEGNTKH